ncbi:MAG TPA: carbohydrate ABC transporter permease [Candidatus Eisenbergiella merdavium]|uniref:Carbohydrate ABC transporter permease n=1 Tax=Candidatus Eisenbergiella merdavium TaxID=2838551 RepID=A0A9D2NFC5_9FIRM|nr:carbohydrate ABC transporter permease [Candidatus Eisenbergiella merdavium]
MAKKKNADYMESQTKFNKLSPFANGLSNILFLLLSLISILPIIFVVVISISSEESITEFGYRLIPRALSADGFMYLFKQKTLLAQALGMSLAVTVLGTLIGTLLTTLIGYVLSRKEFKLHGLYTWLVFIPMIFNGGLVAQYVVTSQLLGLKNTIWALILPLCISSFNVIVSKTFFSMTIPDSLIESAELDGASQFTIFFKLVVPLSQPVFATIALFLCFTYWNDWFQAMLYIDEPAMYTLQAFLNRLMSDITELARNADKMGVSQLEMMAKMPKESARMAVVVVIVAPIACAYPFFQRYFISGLTVGAVKG